MGCTLRPVFQKGKGTSETITETLFRLIVFLSQKIDAKSGEIACSVQVRESSFILRTNINKPRECSVYCTPKPGEVETVACGAQETSSTPMEKPRKDTLRLSYGLHMRLHICAYKPQTCVFKHTKGIGNH